MRTHIGTGNDPLRHQTPPRIERKAATRALHAHVIRFFADVETFLASQGKATGETVEDDSGAERDATPAPPPRFAVIAEASIGKTDAILKALRPEVWQGRRVLYLAPSMTLGDDLKERAQSSGIRNAHVIRGRGQDDPSRPGQKMCAKDDIAAQIAALGYSVTESLCKDKAGNECEHAAGCAYLAQMRAHAKGGALLIGAHAYLSIAMELLKEDKIDLVVIDESFWQSMVRHTSVPIDRFKTRRSPNKEHRNYRVKGEKQQDTANRWMDDADEFHTIHGKAIRAIETAERSQRPLALADFRNEFLSPGDCRFAAKIEYTRLGSADIHPGMTAPEQRDALRNAVSREAFALARVWKLLGAELETGRDGEPMSIRMEIGRVNRAGDLENALVMNFTAEARFQRTPVLILDADGDDQILDRFYPGIRSETIAAEWRNVRVRQVTDRTGSKLFFSNSANRERLKAIGLDLADQFRDRIETPAHRPLMIVQKTVEAAWIEAGERYDYEGNEPLPDAPLQVAHLGNVRGKDMWKHVVALVVAGRVEPAPRELERMARAVFYKSETAIGELVPDAKGKVQLPRRDVLMTAKDGTTATVSVSHHPDERTNRVLHQIREAELSQNIARARPVHREADNPCEILVLTNVPLRIVPDTFATWGQIVPDRWREMGLRGFVPDVSSDVAEAYPDLFATPAAVRQAASRARTCDDSYMGSFYRDCHTFPGMVRVLFRREGNRKVRGGWVAASPGDSAEAVAERVRKALPDAYRVDLVGPLPDPVEAPVAAAEAAAEAAADLTALVEIVEVWGGDIWWRPPGRPRVRPTVLRPFLPAFVRPPDPGETARF